jgi:hypothetical protein
MSEFSQSGAVPLVMSASINLGTQVSVDNFPATQNVSGTIGVDNFPAFQAVSGSVALTNWPAVVGVSSSSPSGFWFGGTAGVSGTVTAMIGNWPAVLGVSSSSPSGFWSAGPNGVTGSVALTNWPAVIGVSSSSPSGFWFGGTAGVSGTVTVGGYSVGVTGSNNVTVTGSTGLLVAAPVNSPLNVTGTLNTQPYGVIQANYSGTVGSLLPLTVTYQGNLQNAEQFAPQAEDNFNGVIATAMLPITASLYAPTTSGTFGGQPPIIKGSGGMLYYAQATSRSTGSVYLQFFNQATLPANGTVPYLSIPILSASSAAGVGNQGVGTWSSPWPTFFSVGIVAGFSSNPTSYTPATNPGAPAPGSYFDVTVQFK